MKWRSPSVRLIMSFCASRIEPRRSTELLSHSRSGLFSRGLLGWALLNSMALPLTIVRWHLAVEQLIEDDTRMVSYAMYHLRGKASEWAYSALMTESKEFPSGAIFKTKIRAMYQLPTNEVLLQACFFSSRQAQRSLQEYVQEMRSLLAYISVVPLPEPIKVPTFLNGLRHVPAQQDLFRKVPSTMEEAIEIALVEDKSYKSALVTSWQKPTTEMYAATPMKLATWMLSTTTAASAAI